MIRLATQAHSPFERPPVTGLAHAQQGAATHGEVDGPLLRMRQARSRPWPFRSMAAEAEAEAEGRAGGTYPGAGRPGVASAGTTPPPTRPSGFSA